MNTHPRSPGSVSRRTFIGQVALGAAGLTILSKSRGQGAPQKKLGVAIVGLGTYGRRIAASLKVAENCQLMGAVTRDPAGKGKQWAAQNGFPETNIWTPETMAQIADNKDIDIVYVITPNSLHAEGVIAAAKAGKHVISEKPFTTSVADAEKAIAACKAAKVKLSIGYRIHFDPFHREVVRMAREKEFGALTRITGGNGFRMGNNQWRAQHKFSGGGPLMDMGLYCLNEACLIANEAAPVAVTANEHPKTRPQLFVDVEQELDWTMEFADGTKAEFMSSYEQNVGKFRAEGDKGWLEMDPAFGYGGYKLTTSKGPVNITPAANQQALQMDDFVKCIREGRESQVSGEMGLRDMKVLEAIYASMAAGGKRTLVRA